jgi:hypothetical protein
MWVMYGVIPEEDNWVRRNGLQGAPLGYRYTTALHWTLTQFTPASMEVNPRNVVERTWACVVLVFALVTFSSFVSSITQIMTTLRNMSGEESRQFWLLRRFLKQRNVGKDLSMRVIKYLEYAYAAQKNRVDEGSVKILGLLSGPLRQDLQYELFAPRLTGCGGHPFLSWVNNEYKTVIQKLCNKAMKHHSLATGDCVFHADDQATEMYVLILGKVNLTNADGSELEPAVHPGDWVSEACLWTTWIHCGDLRTLSESTMVSINASLFGEVMCMHLESWLMAVKYAKQFLELLNQFDALELTDVVRCDEFYMEVLNRIDGGCAESPQQGSFWSGMFAEALQVGGKFLGERPSIPAGTKLAQAMTGRTSEKSAPIPSTAGAAV